MKKILLTLLACIVALGASSALQKAPRMLTTSPGASFGTAVPFTPADTKVPMAKRAAGQTMSMTYSPAYDPYQAIAFQDQETGMQMAQAFQFTRTLTNEFAGNKLTGMFFYTGINMNASTETSSVNTIKKATMFLAYDLQNFEPFYTQTVDLPEAGGTLVSFQFDTLGLQLRLLGKDHLESFAIVCSVTYGRSCEGGIKLPCQSFQLVVDICDGKFSASAGMYQHL